MTQTGKGGFIEGKIKLYEKSSFYLFIGASGDTLNLKETSYTFGGGGSGYSYLDGQYVGSGGGATDIRTTIDDLSTRLIVAGGGGGSGKQTSYSRQSNGGSGSGCDGTDGNGSNDGVGEGATKILSGQNPVAGLFGFGANATQADGCDGSGGGGGYFGGAAGKSYASAGGGGSGYIDTALFYDINYLTGVNSGHGLAYITLLKYLNLKYATINCDNKRFPYSLLYIFIFS